MQYNHILIPDPHINLKGPADYISSTINVAVCQEHIQPDTVASQTAPIWDTEMLPHIGHTSVETTFSLPANGWVKT